MASLPRVRQWLAAQPGLREGGLIDGISAKDRLGFLRVGLGDDHLDDQNEMTGKAKNQLRNVRGRGTEMFVVDAASAISSNRAFFERIVVQYALTRSQTRSCSWA